jgi:hypothetical protein
VGCDMLVISPHLVGVQLQKKRSVPSTLSLRYISFSIQAPFSLGYSDK